jgi:acyl-CoA thioester hydrolase
MTFTYRIYYEDTDSGGVVYYANYLKFFERARTDFLRALNISQSELAEKEGLVFVVKKCEIEYLSPAKLDNLIEVSVEIKEMRQASISMYQEAKLGDKILSRLNVEIVCVAATNFKPKKIPETIKNLFDVR